MAFMNGCTCGVVGTGWLLRCVLAYRCGGVPSWGVRADGARVPCLGGSCSVTGMCFPAPPPPPSHPCRWCELSEEDRDKFEVAASVDLQRYHTDVEAVAQRER